MKTIDRRDFLGGVLATTGTALAATALPVAEAEEAAKAAAPDEAKKKPAGSADAIDFRFSPVAYQTAFCFPDDPCKSLVSESGQLLYGFDNWGGVHYFPMKIGFGLRGMKAPMVRLQKLESPTVPIVYTTLEYPGAEVLLTTFATNESGEGRVDNVILDVLPHHPSPGIDFEPMVEFFCAERLDLEESNGLLKVVNRKPRQLVLAGKTLLTRVGRGNSAGTMGLDLDLAAEADTASQPSQWRCGVPSLLPYSAGKTGSRTVDRADR